MLDRLTPDPAGIRRAVELLRLGEVIAFPTDTVYGLAALASDRGALMKIFAIKGRSQQQPLVLMVPNLESLEEWARIDDRARHFMLLFWPGPLTLVLPARHWLGLPLATGDPPTIAVRIPGDEVAQRLLDELGEAIGTTSANRSGEEPARDFEAAASLPGLAAGLDGGILDAGMPSTILDLSAAEPRILRAGSLGSEDLFGSAGRI